MKLKLFAMSLFLLCTNAYTVNIMPEVRTTVSVSQADINRISCESGLISSIDYASNTGLTHKTHKNKKNVVILFKQLDDGRTRKIINAKINMLIGCGNEYYPLILDPQKIDSQSIFLQTSSLESEARKNNQENTVKTHEEVLIDLIKSSRKKISGVMKNQPSVYFDNLQVKLLNKQNIYGTNYQVNKFVVIGNNVTLIEKQFLNTQLSKYPIVAISLDDFHLNNDKNWTYLYLIVENWGAQ
ncbi:TraK domain-containing protein [Bathymodiolus thermophilus thioautotrophic gill symbiont]|uniref:TraK N-terminal domain-containing protein n=1 Tax=Bathymodiolus thermophilus thioautotrophic gill symbiont TaxID=2360 RepID=A0A1J5UN28_9GAMM|nr:type-F conjugative transfer system secretin TraK [Bathymodiolus thermophilus thioautotrophic gill symbiont]AYQ57068.1 hypothetical protein MS2017_1380 [Bathymodiolus thermophilus thioautotrophic gill symbiont]OIR25631.1 hypothetical protein BGC33_13730 [Bathymodiolus thermophilus thioautotrophic gill symbiont]